MPKVSFSASDTLSNTANYFVAALYDNSAPTVLVESIQILPKPYTVPFQWMFATNLITGHGYTLKIWESADDTPTGVVRNSTSFTAKVNTAIVKVPQYMTVGITPGLVADTTTMVCTEDAGWDYTLERVGVNLMYPEGATDVTDPDYRQTVTGGIELLRTGETFQSGEKFVKIYVPQLSNFIQTVAFIQSGQILTTDTVLDNTYVDQALYLQGASDHITITLPDLATVGDYKTILLKSAGGSHTSAIILTHAANYIQVSSNVIQQVVLLQGDPMLKLFKANGVWNIEGESPNIRTGEIVYSYRNNMPDNYVFADGGAYNANRYRSIYNYALGLGGDAVTTEAHYNDMSGGEYINHGKWTLGDGSYVRVPTIYGHNLLPVDGSTALASDFKKQILGTGSDKLLSFGIYALIRL